MQKLNIGVFKRALITSSVVSFVLLLLIVWAMPVYAHKDPANCTGSGLSLNLYSNVQESVVGGAILYSLEIFNGVGVTPIVCNATGITASIVTPDSVVHPITLVRTTLTHGQNNSYNNVVSYVVREQDIEDDGTLRATASNTGVIHQNDTDSEGGSNQAVNVTVAMSSGTLRVIKTVVNQDGSNGVPSDFSVYVKESGTNVTGSPTEGVASPGTSYTLAPDTYVVSEDTDSNYTASFSGDCNSSGSVTVTSGTIKTCTITNTRIDEPSSGGGGGGGNNSNNDDDDEDEDEDEEANEIAIVSAVATGSLPSPRINIVKVPSRLTPFLFGGGSVIYKYIVTNPGIVPMHSVIVMDNRCNSIAGPLGDENLNNLLDPGELWIYVCQTNVPVTTTNVALAEGQGNGFTVINFAFAHVLVGNPFFPNAGFAPRDAAAGILSEEN